MLVHIEQNEAITDQFTFYPNPVVSGATLRGDFYFSGKVTMRLFNANGAAS